MGKFLQMTGIICLRREKGGWAKVIPLALFMESGDLD